MKAGEWYSGRASGYNFIVRAKPLIAEADEKDYYNLHFRGYSTDFDIRIPTEELNNYLTECEKPDHSRKHPIPPPRSYQLFKRIGVQNPTPSPRLPSGPSMQHTSTPTMRRDRIRSKTPPRVYYRSPSGSSSRSPPPMGRRQNREERNRESRSQSRWRGMRNERDESEKIPIKPIKAEVESDDDLQIVSWTLNESSDRRLIEEKEKLRKKEMAERQRKREQKREQGGGAPSPHVAVFAQTVQKTEPDASVKDNSWQNTPPPPPPGCFPPPGYFPYHGYPYYGYPHHPPSPANMGYSPAQPIPGSPIPDPNMMYGYYNPFYPYASPQQLHPHPPQGFQQPLQPHPYFGQPPYTPANGSAYGQQPSTPLPYDTATPRRPPNRGIPSLPSANEDATNMPEAAPVSGSLPRGVETSNDGESAEAETTSNVEMSTPLTSLITHGTSTVSAGSVVLDTVPQQREASNAVSSAAAPVVDIYSTPKITPVVVEDSTNCSSDSNSRSLPVVEESVNEQCPLSSIGSAVTIDQSIQSAVFSDDEEENEVEMEKETTEVVPSFVVLETVPVTEDAADIVAPLSQQIVTDENQIVSASVPPLTPCHTIQLNEGSGNVVQSDVSMEMVDGMDQSNTSERVIENNGEDVSSDDTANVISKDKDVREETVQPTPSPSCDPSPNSHLMNQYAAILAAMKVTMDSELQTNGMASELIQKINQFIQSNIVVQVEESVQSVSSTHSEVPLEDATPPEHPSISSGVVLDKEKEATKEKEVPLEDATPSEYPSISPEVLDKEKEASKEKDVSLEDGGGHPDPEHPSTSSEIGQEEEQDTTETENDSTPPEHPTISSDALEKKNETTNGKDSDVPLEDDGHLEHPAMSSDALEMETTMGKDVPLEDVAHPEHPSTSSEIGQEEETTKEKDVPLEDVAHSEHPSISSEAVLKKGDETAKEKNKVDNVDVGQSLEVHGMAKLEPFEIDYGCLMVDMSMYSTIPSIEDDSTDYIDMEEEMNEMSQMVDDEEEKEEECEEHEKNMEKENEEMEENEKEAEMNHDNQTDKDSEETVKLDKLTLEAPDLVEDVLGSEALESEKNVEEEETLASVPVELSTEELVLVERVVGTILDEVCVDIEGRERNEVEEHDQVDQIASGDFPNEVVSNGEEEVPVSMDVPVKIELEDDYLSAIGPSDLSISSSNRSRLGDDLPEDLTFDTEDSFGTANYCSSSPRTISSPPLEREEMIPEDENEEEKKDDTVDSECDEYLTDDDEKNESDQSTVELDFPGDMVIRSIEEQSAEDFAESEKADTDGLEDTNEDTDDTNNEESKEKKVHWKTCVEVVELSDEDEEEDEEDEEEEEESEGHGETEEGNCRMGNDVEEREEEDVVEISDDEEKEEEVEKEDDVEDEVVCCEIVVNTEKEKNVDCNSGEDDDIVEISDDEEEDNQEYCEFVEEETSVQSDNNCEEDELYEIEENNMVNERDEQEESVEKEEEEEVVQMDSDKEDLGDEECVKSGEEEREKGASLTDGGEEHEKGDEEENEEMEKDEDEDNEREEEEEEEPPVKRIRLDPGSFGILKGLVKGKCSVDEDEGDVKPSREFVLSIRNSCADVVDNNNLNVVNRVDVDERENGDSQSAISSSGSSSEHDNVAEERSSSEHYSI